MERSLRQGGHPVFQALTLVLVLLALCPRVPVSAAFLYPQRFISIVYDDSGSMQQEGKSDQANYALQTLCALLDRQDILYVTRMGKPDTAVEVPIQEDRQSAIDALRYAPEGGGYTPYEAVQTAMDVFRDQKKRILPNTECWLIVLSDGIMQRSRDRAEDPAQVERRLKEFARTAVVPEVTPRVAYFAIGSDAATFQSEPENGFFAYQSQADEIVARMQEIADLVSGRARASARYLEAREDSILFRNQLSLRKLVILSQNRAIGVSNVTIGGVSMEYSAEDIYRMESPAGMIFGCLAQVFPKDLQDVIPPGDVEVHFSGDVDPQAIEVLYEPAVFSRIQILQNDVVVTDPDTAVFRMGDRFSLRLEFTDAVSGRVIPADLMPDALRYRIVVEQNGVTRTFDDPSVHFELEKGPMSIRATAEIEDFYRTEQEIQFEVFDVRKIELRDEIGGGMAILIRSAGVDTADPPGPLYRRRPGDARRGGPDDPGHSRQRRGPAFRQAGRSGGRFSPPA